MEKKKGKKGIVIAAVVMLAIVIGAIVFLNLNKKKVYRLLKIYEVEGKANVSREDTGNIEKTNNQS